LHGNPSNAAETAEMAQGLGFGDHDGDGHLDVANWAVTTSYTPYTSSIPFAGTYVTFSLTPTIVHGLGATPNNDYRSWKRLDVDRDGREDIVRLSTNVSAGGAATLAQMEPRLRGASFQTKPAQSLDLGIPGMVRDSFRPADIDGDGCMDFVAPRYERVLVNGG